MPWPACLFNIALEKVIRDANINTRGTIFFKSVQILAYADGTDIIDRTEMAMKEAFINLEKAAYKMHLKINQEKQNIYQSQEKIAQVILHV
jgi:protein-disulfide isomerase-like protein with CxxC motif